jgi:hypothetical protein
LLLEPLLLNIFRAAIDSILSITYGITPTDFEHPFIKVTGEVNEIFADVARGGYLGSLIVDFEPSSQMTYFVVDVFPFLKKLPRWFPGFKFREIGDRGRKLARDVVQGPYSEIQSQVVNIFSIPRSLAHGRCSGQGHSFTFRRVPIPFLSSGWRKDAARRNRCHA